MPSFSCSVIGRSGRLTVTLSRTPISLSADFMPDRVAALGPPLWASWETLATVNY